MGLRQQQTQARTDQIDFIAQQRWGIGRVERLRDAALVDVFLLHRKLLGPLLHKSAHGGGEAVHALFEREKMAGHGAVFGL
jgi:hypothetical protein